MAEPATSGRLPVAEEKDLSQLTNGGETPQNGPRRWERPWSLHEIHEEAGNWSLAGDAGLLQHLQEFSQRMISHTHQIGKEVDDLVHDAKLMDVKVNNVINDFIMLANNQFVENRVYDEDVSEDVNTKEEKKIEQEKTKEQREAELIPRVAFALKLGIDIIDNAFVKLDPRVADSDSEEEDNAGITEAILEAKDPYVTRPLPFLIGTPQFMEDDNIGLVEDLSDKEPDSDQGSISVSEDDDGESEESQREYSTSEESEEADRKKSTEVKKRLQTVSSSASDDDDSDQDMFSVKRSRAGRSGDDSAHSGDVSASDEDEPQRKGRPAPPIGIPKDLSSELASRLGVGAPKQAAERARSDEAEDGWREKSAEQKRKDSQSSGKHPHDVHKEKKKDRVEGKSDKLKGKHSKHIYEDDLFGQDERQDEDDDLFSKDGGLFSSSKGLFDDGDEGDLFEDVKKPAVKTQKPNKKEEKSNKREDSLYAGDLRGGEAEGDDRLPLPKPKTSSIHTVKKPTAQPAAASVKGVGKAAGGGLFDESEEEDDDLFGVASKKVDLAKKVESPVSPKKTANPAGKKLDLFIDDAEDDNEDLFGSMAASVAKNKPHSNVGLTVEGYDEVGRVEEKRLEDEQLRRKATPEKKLPPGSVSMFGKSPNPILEALKKQQQIPSSSDEDDNLSLPTEDGSSRNSSIHSTSSATSGLRAGERTKNVPSLSTNILDSKEEDDSLFTSKPKPGSKSLVEKDSNVSKNISKTPDRHQEKPEKIKSSKDSLFDSNSDENDVDIFSSAVKPVESKRPGKQVSMFGNAAIGATKTDKEAPSKLNSQPATKKKASTLFDDDDEDDDEPLFSSKSPQAAGGADTSKNKTQGLFARDDFHSVQDENPAVDLFSSKEPVIEHSHKNESPQQQQLPVVAAAKKTTPTSSRPGTINLFSGDDDDDDDDGDLFSVRPVKSPAAMKATTVVTEAGSSDAVTAKEGSKPHIKERKKLAGAVSMFGELDPSAFEGKSRPTYIPDENSDKKDVKEVKEEKKTLSEKNIATNVSVAKPLSATDLFGGGDDEDLFSPRAGVGAVAEGVPARESANIPDKEVAKASKPEIKPKKPAGAVVLTGTVDPSGFLQKQKIVEPKEEKKNEVSENKKSPPPQIAAKPKILKEKSDNIIKPKSVVGGDLFGGDGDDSDDLFAASTKKATPPPIAPKSHASPAVTAKERPKSHASPAETAPAIPKERPKSEREATLSETGRPKAPAGGVSMFGGIDPFAAMKRASVSSETDHERESSQQKDIPPNLTLYNDPLSVLASPVTVATTNKTSFTPDILSSEVRVQDIGHALSKSLDNTVSVDFDQPVETETLTNASKDRPKLNRRRPQSRKARVQAAAQTGINFEEASTTSTMPATLPLPSVATLPQSSVATLPQSSVATSHQNHQHVSEDVRPRPKCDLFGNDELLDGLSAHKDKPRPLQEQRASDIDGLFSSDLFNGKGTKLSRESSEDVFSDLGKHDSAGSHATIENYEAAKNEIIKNKDAIFDLFSKTADNSTAGDLSSVYSHDVLHFKPSASTRTKAKVTNDIDDDDLFASSAKASATKSKNVTEKDDDLFSSAFQPSSVTGHSMTGQEKGDIFHDDDIFRSSTPSKQKDAKTMLGSSTTERDDSKDVKKPDDVKSARPKRAVTKESNLLSDTTDIFSNVPTMTPREPKNVPTMTPREPKKKTPKKVPEKNVFQGDIDDIFADSTAVTIKPKRKMTKPTTAVSDNIFDDPLS